MISREKLKNEVDKIPDHLLEEAYGLLKSVVRNSKGIPIDWNRWKKNLENFSNDFMVNRNQPFNP